MMFEFGRRNGVSLPYADAEAVRRAYRSEQPAVVPGCLLPGVLGARPGTGLLRALRRRLPDPR